MANNAIFSYGGNGKRKIGHSKFDMTHEHIMSARFGELRPAAVFETLPDDYWDVSDNTVTLLKPLTAPAMTRINQNFYGAYVRNQQIWKYWNDYISNGTAYGDVYGNNVTNQALKNVWDVPSIPTPYLQSILKIGNGNASPLFHYETTCTVSGGVPTGDLLASFCYKNITWLNFNQSNVKRVTDAIYAAFQIPAPTFFPIIKDRASAIGFTENYAFDCYAAHDSSGKWYFHFELYCSMRQFLAFRSAFTGTVDLAGTPTFSEIGSSENQVNPELHSSYLDSVLFRFFSDEVSPDPHTSESAFLIEKQNYIDQFDSTVVKSLDYFPRHVDNKLELIYSDVVSSTSGMYCFQSIFSAFWGFRYCVHITSQGATLYSSNYCLPNFNSSTDFYWYIAGSDLGVTTLEDADALFTSWLQSVHYLGVSADMHNQLDRLYGSSYATQVNFSTSPQPQVVLSSPCSGQTSLGYISTNIYDTSFCDSIFYYLRSGSNYLQMRGYNPTTPCYSRDSRALGYDITSLCTYLCRNSAELMDSFGIKVDPLSARPLWHYRYELTNALPFFAYDKIWNDNFRNPVVSSPSLDWSEANSVMFAVSGFYSNFVFSSDFLDPSVVPSRYFGKSPSDFSANSWVLEVACQPRNGQGSAIHTHLPVDSSNWFSLLTGFGFDVVFVNLNSTTLNVNNYYLPSYYNGLLHLKFQNFNKDYFTSALLDPMSGANQVAIPSTVSELRQAEAEQHWWERTAMYRSIRNFFQGTYGITPIELPEDSRITGTDHIDVNIGEVIQTSGTTPESPQGNRSGLGGCRGSGTLVHGHANEHGWIFILVSHTVESQYLQNYDKMWDVKESFLDYPTVDFAGIGNESILQKEVNYTTVPTAVFDTHYSALARQSKFAMYYLPCGSSASISYRGKTNPLRIFPSQPNSARTGYYNIASAAGTSLDNVFGFTPRYSSYKFKFDQVSGQFRHELAFWHTFKRYLTMPILCHEFVNWELAADDDEINRIFAVSDDFLDDKFAIDCYINASVDRALPFVCVPSSK